MNTTEPVKGKAHKSPNYLGVFLALAAITAVITGIELYVVQLGIVPTEVINATFVVLAVVKATLVALFYMHLKFDSRVYSVLFGVPVLFAVMLVAILLLF